MEATIKKLNYLLYKLIPFLLYFLIFLDVDIFVKDSFRFSFIQSCFVGYFLGYNCYFLGLYLDYVFKIYYHLNSSLDRMIYRIIFGSSLLAFIYSFFSAIFGQSSTIYLTYSLIIINLIFSIYPTTAKLIFSSMSSNLGELKHLDKVEKMLLGIFLIYFICSIPNIQFVDISGYNSFLTLDFFHQNFIFARDLFNRISTQTQLLGYFYFFLGGMYYLIAYSFFRFFFSRRVALIGILALVSNWNLIKLVYGDFTVYGTALYLLSFLWGVIWVGSSKSYRTNLFFGMILALSSHHQFLISLSFFIIGLSSIFLTSGLRTTWAKLQSLKYMSFGLVLTLIFWTVDFFNSGKYESQANLFFSFNNFFKKSFNILGILGSILFLIFYIGAKTGYIQKVVSFLNHSHYLFFSMIFTLVVWFSSNGGSYFDISSFLYFIIVLFSLPILELVLNTFGFFHPKRNLIFFLYILFAILDSHLESRIKTLISIF